MQAKGVVDSLLLMGIEPHHFLVLPRMLGLLIALPLLTFWADIAAVAGGALINAWHGAVSVPRFVEACLTVIQPLAALQSTLMVLVYALAIGVVHCHYGLQAQTSTDVQRNLALAFVRSLLACVAVTVLFGVTNR